MHPQSISAEQRAALLAPLALVGKERQAIHAHGALSYARVSRSIQQTIEAQLRCNLQTATRLDVPVVYELQDTASGLDKDRPGYRELLRLAETGQYSHVLVFKADRLSRDDTEFVNTVRGLLRLGMRVEDHLIGPITNENVGVLALLAYMELRAISQRTTMRLKDLAQGGKKLGRPRYGYMHGPESGTWLCDPVTGPHVTELYRRVDRGDSLGSVQRWFNATTGLHRRRDQIVAMLASEYYKGLNVNCKVHRSKLEGRAVARPKEEWAVSYHQAPLIDEATWERVQQRLRLHANVGQHRDAPARYALSGLLWCVACQRRMSGHTRKDGAQQYRCQTCGAERSLRKIETAVLGLLRHLPIRAEHIAQAKVDTIEAERAELDAELADVDRGLAKITKRRVQLGIQRADDEMTQAEYRAALDETDVCRHALQARRADVESRLSALPAVTELSRAIVDRISRLDSWTELLRGHAVDVAQELYRECITNATYDHGANTLTVAWTAHIAPFMAARAQTVSIA